MARYHTMLIVGILLHESTIRRNTALSHELSGIPFDKSRDISWDIFREYRFDNKIKMASDRK